MSEGPVSIISRFVHCTSSALQETKVLPQDAKDEALEIVARDMATLRKFSLSSPSGYSYPAFLFEPPTFDGDHPCAIVYCASELPEQSQPEAIHFAQRIVPLGISVFILGLTGAHSALFEPGTVVEAVKFLRSIDERSYERVALWGRSAGAIAALQAAVEDPSFVALVCDSAYSDLISLLDLPQWVEAKLIAARQESIAAAQSSSGTTVDHGVEVHAPADLQPTVHKRAGDDGIDHDETPEEAARREAADRYPLEIEGGVTVISEPFDMSGWMSSVGVSSTDFDVGAWRSTIVSQEPPIELAKRCHVPAIFMHGKADDVVPISHCQALTNAYAGECMALHVDGLDHDAPRCLPHMASAALFLIGMFGKDDSSSNATTLALMAALRRCANVQPESSFCRLDLELSGRLQSAEPADYRQGLLLAALAACPEHRAANLQQVTLPAETSSVDRAAPGKQHRYLSRLEGKALLPELVDEVAIAWVISDDSLRKSVILRSERQRFFGAVYFLTISAQLLKLSIVHFEPEDMEPEREEVRPKFILAGLHVYVQRPAVRVLNHFPSQIPFPVQVVLCESHSPALTGGAGLGVAVREKTFKATAEPSSSSSSKPGRHKSLVGVSLFSGDYSASTAGRPRLELQVLPLGNERSPKLHEDARLSALRNSGHLPDGLPRLPHYPLATSSSCRDVRGTATLLTQSSLMSRQDGSLTLSNASSTPASNKSETFPSFNLGAGTKNEEGAPQQVPLTSAASQSEDLGVRAGVEAETNPEAVVIVPVPSLPPEEDTTWSQDERFKMSMDLPFIFDVDACGCANHSWPEEKGRACQRLERHTWAAPGGLR